MDCCAYEDILEPLSLISLAVQADSGSSLAEAAQLIDNLHLKLSTLEAICGSVEQETLHRYEKGTAGVNDDDIPMLGRSTRLQQADNSTKERSHWVAKQKFLALDQSMA